MRIVHSRQTATLLKEIDLSGTFDGWTGLAGTRFISLTAHFIDSGWKFQERWLACTHLPGSICLIMRIDSHTAKHQSDFLMGKCLQFGISVWSWVLLTDVKFLRQQTALLLIQPQSERLMLSLDKRHIAHLVLVTKLACVFMYSWKMR